MKIIACIQEKLRLAGRFERCLQAKRWFKMNVEPVFKQSVVCIEAKVPEFAKRVQYQLRYVWFL